jgi:beta-lactamase class A
MVIFVGTHQATKAQSLETDKKLQQALTEITKDFDGLAGVYVYNLKTNKEAGVHADSIFPTASIVKVPILIGLFDKIAQGKYELHEPLIYREDRAYGGSGLMQFFKDSTKIDLRTAAALMITYSDNTTSLWSQEMAGGGEDINKLMADLGLEHTRVNSRTEGREDIWEIYGWGQTTPREMASLLVKMRNRELINPAISEEMYRMMTNSFYTDYALSEIPPYVQTAAKQGMVNRSRSELVMVNAPHGDYVFYFATKGNKDDSWDYNNEAWELSREISAYLWDYFEPGSSWEPAEGMEELMKGMPY